jgi:ABC-type uncharacterized transport system substrate-binding protein
MTIVGEQWRSPLRCGLALAAALVLVARSAPAQQVGILLSAQRPAYDEAVLGFRTALQERHPDATFSALGAVGDRGWQVAVARFSGECLLAVGSRALTTLVAADPPQPIAFAMVLNPMDDGLWADGSSVGRRTAGAALNLSVATQLRALHQILPAVKTIGGVTLQGRYTAWEQLGRQAARGLGMVWLPIHPTRLQEIPEALAAVGPIAALIPAPDPDLLVPRAFRILSRLARRGQFGLVTPSAQFVRAGALLGMEASWTEVGRLAAQQAARLLAGERDISPPVVYPQVAHVWVNRQRARDLRLLGALRPYPQLELWEGH